MACGSSKTRSRATWAAATCSLSREASSSNRGSNCCGEGELVVGQLKTLLHASPLASPTMPLAAAHSRATLTPAAIAARKILRGKLALAAPPAVSPLDLLLQKLTAGLHQASLLRIGQGIAKLRNVPADGPDQVSRQRPTAETWSRIWSSVEQGVFKQAQEGILLLAQLLVELLSLRQESLFQSSRPHPRPLAARREGPIGPLRTTQSLQLDRPQTRPPLYRARRL